MSELEFEDSVLIARSPEVLYDLVSDVTRTGEWSPICKSCWWDEGDGLRQGAWFTGHNETLDRTWETRSQVSVAAPGREFSWLVGGAWVRWSYTMKPALHGTQLTESWEFLPAGIALFHERYGDAAESEIEIRTTAAHRGIPATLAAIKRIAEAD